MSELRSGWNLPPGCFERDIEDAQGVGECPRCVAEEWRQRVLGLLDDAPMRDRDRELYDDRLREMAEEVADDVSVYVEGEDGELCSKHAPRKEDYDD